MIEWQARKMICEIGSQMYAKDLVCANEGNLSIRLGETLLATPTGLCKGHLQPEDLVTTDLEGTQLGGRRNVSSEIKMHVVVYKGRPDVKSVCHGHPVYGTAHAVAGIPLQEALMPEVVLTLGCVPIAPYGTPSTDELANSLKHLVPKHNAILLANHGAITLGSDLREAFFRMEILEHFAKISLLTRILGRQSLLTKESVDKLFDVSGKYGINAGDSRQVDCPVTANEEQPLTLTPREIEDIVEKVLLEIDKGR